jgi:SAM-dependent methyltransferase
MSCVPPLVVDRWPTDRPTTPQPSVLRVSEDEILQVARRCGPNRPVPLLCLKAATHELTLRYLHRVRFRLKSHAAVRSAYEAMSLDDFAIINAPQSWSNWRTIPRNLNGRLPNQPVNVVDLCCGTGESTAVLAHYCRPGSRILGLEWNAAFVAAARRRTFRCASGQVAATSFRVQDVLTTFRDAAGRRLRDRSVDLLHCQGALGVHFEADAIARLANECDRVTKSGGLVMLDVARRGECATHVTATWESRGYALIHRAESCPWDRFVQLCFRKQ